MDEASFAAQDTPLNLIGPFPTIMPTISHKKHIKYQPRQYLMLFSEAHVAQRNDMFTTNNSYSTYIMLKNHVNYALIKLQFITKAK